MVVIGIHSYELDTIIVWTIHYYEFVYFNGTMCIVLITIMTLKHQEYKL